MLQSHGIEVFRNTGGVWKKTWRRWAFYGLRKPVERRFSGKTRTFRANELPQSFEILQRPRTHLLSLNPKKLQILVWDFEPLFKVTSGSLGSATGDSKNGRILFSGQKCNAISKIDALCLKNPVPVTFRAADRARWAFDRIKS